MVRSYLLVGVASGEGESGDPVGEYYRNRSGQLLPKFDSLSPGAVPTAGYANANANELTVARSEPCMLW
ncbi:hypothetical protein [Chamaesiphon sp. OTE_8_metabat_110]|uniref:hypothetical protein n=1 Tax=Chamaesiphon sp. OTE_8_metabat_110 TaxID=2964696 RepID=UPI00286CBB5A|nr:hypothetical protein [Chamaesiphon sp. OTE_8_metabat_110]